MAKKPTPLAGEATTTNYGWVKPTVGSTVDLWGGYINADLDGIDSIVHGIDARIIGDNRIINGDMRIDQRYNGATGSANGVYTVDRWFYAASQASKGSWTRYNPSGATGFPYCLNFTSSSAYASLAADYFIFYQPIEADMVSDFAWGTGNAQPVTLSFMAFSSLTGTFGGSVRNATGTRSYPFSYSIAVAGAWTRIVVAVPPDMTGTWVLSGNAASVVVQFDLGSGSSFRGPAGTWASTNYNGVTGAASVVAVNAATFFITGVKLEIGSVATPFNRQSLAKSMADCQRYYQSISQASCFMFAPGPGPAISNGSLLLPVTMRAQPTVTLVSPVYGNANTLAVNRVGVDEIRLSINTLGAGQAYGIAVPMTLSAEL